MTNLNSESRPPVLLLVCLLAAGCGFDLRRREQYLHAHPDLAPKFRQAIREGKARVGMSAADVTASLGQPTKEVESEDEKEGLLVLWIYDYSYVYGRPVYGYGLRHHRHHYQPGQYVQTAGIKVWFRGKRVVRFEEY